MLPNGTVRVTSSHSCDLPISLQLPACHLCIAFVPSSIVHRPSFMSLRHQLRLLGLSLDDSVDYVLVPLPRAIEEPPIPEEAKLPQFARLNTVLEQFLQTATHAFSRVSLDDMLATTSTVQEPLYLRYEHESIPYVAAVYRKQTHAGPQVSIKLNNDGFAHAANPARQRYPRNDGRSAEWQAADADVRDHMPAIRANFADRYTHAEAHYNVALMRLDITLTPADLGAHPHVLITFEPGHPDYDFERREGRGFSLRE